MTYSCSDFTDDIIEALGAHIPERCKDSPRDQAVICGKHISNLLTTKAALLVVAKNLITSLNSAPDRARNDAIIKQAQQAIKLAETPPERWPDEEDAA